MRTITLKLDGATPQGLTLAQLSKYLKELSQLYGKDLGIYFDRVSEGSAQLDSNVPEESLHEVIRRVSTAAQCLHKTAAGNAYKRLKRLLDEDGFSGRILAGNTEILTFPKASNDSLRTITKSGAIQGVLYSVGGKDDTIPVYIEGANGEVLKCETDRETARELAHHLFRHIRAKGKGKWVLTEDGAWRLKKLVISEFRVLNSRKFKTAMNELRNRAKFKWPDSDTPHQDILKWRE